MRTKATLLSTIAVSVVLHVDSAAAQTSGESRSTSAELAGLEEIVVTARKREESLQDVPVVAAVLDQAALEQYATDDLFALKNRVPNLLMGAAVGSTGTQVSLRGVGTTTLNATMEQSVALNIDGLALTQGLAYSAGLFDAAQVEVLKGPQSLFFGKNNTAGVISLRSADPTDTFELIARAGYETEADEMRTDLIISGPVSDSLKLRLATRYSDGDGYFKNTAQVNPALGGRAPAFDAPNKNLIVRGTALFEPSSAYTARLKLNYAKDEMEGAAPPLQVGHCPEGTASVPPVNIPFLQGETCKIDRYFNLAWADPAAFPGGLPNNGVAFLDQEQIFGTLEQELNFSDEWSLVSVTGYYDSNSPILQLGGTTSATMPHMLDIQFDNRQFTQELRLSSAFDGPVNFMIGAFYQDADQYNDVRVLGNVLLGLPAVLQDVKHHIDIRSYSLFGQAMWDITDKLELAVGARWSDEEREHSQYNLNPGNGPVGPVDRPDPKIDSSHVSPEVSLTYEATDDLTLFASYKTGYKSGSFSSLNFIPATTRASFDDEEVKGGEIGVKARTPDRTFTANLAAYYYEYDDLQVGAMDLSGVPGSAGFVWAARTINAASAKVRGVELDLTWAPRQIDGLSIHAAVNYNHARYDSFPNAPCGNGQTVAEGCDDIFNPATGRYLAQDLSGRRLVRAPDWTGTLGFDYDAYIGSDWTLAFGANVNYTSEYSTTLVDLPGFEQDEAIKLDANITLRSPGETWELALIGRNLGDELTRAWCVNSNIQNGTLFGGQISGDVTSGPAGGDEAGCSVDRGREVWARVSYRF